MKKVVFGVLIVFGFNVWSFGAEIGQSKFFMGAACSERFSSMSANFFITVKSLDGVTPELLNFLEKEVNGQKGCHFLSSENIKFNVYKKTKKFLTVQKNTNPVLFHNALVTIVELEGKPLKKLVKDNKLAKVLSGVKLWISRPYINENYKKVYPLLKFKNGKTW